MLIILLESVGDACLIDLAFKDFGSDLDFVFIFVAESCDSSFS